MVLLENLENERKGQEISTSISLASDAQRSKIMQTRIFKFQILVHWVRGGGAVGDHSTHGKLEGA